MKEGAGGNVADAVFRCGQLMPRDLWKRRRGKVEVNGTATKARDNGATAQAAWSSWVAMALVVQFVLPMRVACVTRGPSELLPKAPMRLK